MTQIKGIQGKLKLRDNETNKLSDFNFEMFADNSGQHQKPHKARIIIEKTILVDGTYFPINNTFLGDIDEYDRFELGFVYTSYITRSKDDLIAFDLSKRPEELKKILFDQTKSEVLYE